MHQQEEENEVIHSDQYYSSMLKALKDDEDRHAALERDDFGPGRIIKKNKGKSAMTTDDPTSPYHFMKTVKFHLWNKAFQTKNSEKAVEEEKKKALKATRDERRMIFLSSKEADYLNLLPKSGDKSRLLLSQLHSVPRTAMERKVEKDLLNQYRKDEDNYKRLLKRIEASQEAAPKEPTRPKTPKQTETIHEKMSLDEKLRNARVKRETMVLQANQLHLMDTQSKLQRSEHLQKLILTPSESRVLQWLSIINALYRMNYFGEVVRNIRSIREKNIVSWRAARLIQKAWRRLKDKNTTKKKENLLETLKKNMNHQSHQSTFEIRCESASLIIRFLKETRFRAIVNIFFKRIRRIQTDFRHYSLVTEHRIHLLHKLIDCCVQPLSHHINAVLAGRGLDLKNLSFFEQTHLKNLFMNKSSSSISMLREMYTEDFHSILRLNANKLFDFHREYVVSGNRLWNDTRYSEQRKELLRNFLLMKRRQFIEDLMKRHTLDLHIPQITIDEVRAFIQSHEVDSDDHRICGLHQQQSVEEGDGQQRQGKYNNTAKQKVEGLDTTTTTTTTTTASVTATTTSDPLKRYLQVIEDKIAEHYETRRYYQSPFRYKDENGELKYYTKENAYLMPRLLLLTSMKPHEVLSILLQFLEVVKAQQQSATTGGYYGEDGAKSKAIRGRLNMKGDPDSPNSDFGSASNTRNNGVRGGNISGIGSPSGNSSSSSLDVCSVMSGNFGGVSLQNNRPQTSNNYGKSSNGTPGRRDIHQSSGFNELGSPTKRPNTSKLNSPRKDNFSNSYNTFDSSTGFTAVRPAMPLSSSSLMSPHRKAAVKNNKR